MSVRHDTRLAVPTEEEQKAARLTGRQLAKRLGLVEQKKTLKFRDEEGPETLELPAAAVRLLLDILAEMGKGNAVTIVPIHAELSTQQAADILNVSRPYIVKLVAQNKLPARKVGTRRRILAHDLMLFQRAADEERLRILNELTETDQELGLQ